ncbi:hypothetical protein HYC85_021790 [Camellia sinensis]|uniref:Carotene epsilon-monooxygenase n=1 Tax=Camellia sinensis TaxID=4442 RepID=A0A7J7GIK3_CAMSI|nr:hypothetical protein HYC85_021790 [Camellia sinensis]
MPSSLSLSSFSLHANPSHFPHPLYKPTIPYPSTNLPKSLAIKSSIDKPEKPTNNTTKQSSWVSPDWLTSLAQSLSIGKDDSSIPIANAKLEDVSELLGGALFLPLFKWMQEYGPIYRLAAGPRNFVVVSDPAIAKHVLRNYGKYAKGLVAEVSEFLFGSGFAIAEGQLWTVRRRAVVPSLHKTYLSVIVDRVFCKCAERLVEKLKTNALNGSAVNMEENFSQLTLDVIGLALFNYNFDSLTTDSPINALCKIIPRQIKAEKAVTLIRKTVEELINKCKEIVESEGERINEEEYVNETDPSILRFLLASREEVSSIQLRDDLLSMLVAGHETTGSVLTWTAYLLSKDPSSLSKAQEEVDRVLQGRSPTYEDIKNLKFLTRCINESLRLYPHPPVLLRRAQVADVLPGNYKVNPGQDIMISVYNIHHSPQEGDNLKSNPHYFLRLCLGQSMKCLYQKDLTWMVQCLMKRILDFRFIPFSGGPRKCIGDQFALLEAIVALAIFVQHMDFELVPDQNISMTTGATIHTEHGLYMKVSQRQTKSAFAASSSSSR